MPELYRQITSYEAIVNSYTQTDSIKEAQVKRLMLYAQIAEQVMQDQSKEMAKLNSKNKLHKGLTIGGISVSVGLLIALLLK